MIPPLLTGLRAVAARLFEDSTIERVIDPMLTDLWIEYRDAVETGRLWKSRWIRFAGYVAFMKVIAICGWERVVPSAAGWTADDDRALRRTIGVSIAAVMAAAFLLLAPPLLRLSFRVHAEDWRMLVYLVPQTIPLAVPVGLTIGIFWGLRSRAASRYVTRALLTLSVIGSLGSFATMGWIVPAANQAFREAAFRRMARATDVDGSTGTRLVKGIREQTLVELRQQAASQAGVGRSGQQVAFRYHFIWALPWASLALALFALSVVNRWYFGRISLWMIALGTYVGYYVLLLAGRMYGLDGTLPAYAAAWLPNLVFAAFAAALTAVRSPRANDASG